MNTYIGLGIGSVLVGFLQLGFQPPTEDKINDSDYKKELRRMLTICKDSECQTIQKVLLKAK